MHIKKYFILLLICFQSATLLAKDYKMSTFGINSDGKTLNTRAIQFAIDYIHDNGGGRLVFYVGRYLTGSIHLKSNVTLHLKEGAVLLGSVNPFDYDKDGFTALIFAKDQSHIAITGKGTINGQGNLVALNVINNIEKGLLNDAYRNGRPSEDKRPMNLYIRDCDNITVRGITLKNSPCWNQTYDHCQQLTIDSITVNNTVYWNEDGVDIVDCEDVKITHNYIDASDDGICLKSHRADRACKNILIQNNTIRSSANGIKFGTASRGGFENIKIINNTVFNTYRSALALEAVDGGYIDQILVDGLQSNHTGNIIFMCIGARLNGKRGRLENVRISNVSGDVPATKPDMGYSYEGPIEDLPRNISPAIIITGLPDALISNITIDEVQFSHAGGAVKSYANVPLDQLDLIPELPKHYPEFSMFKELPAWGIFIRHAKGVHFSNIKMKADKKDFRVPIVLDDVKASSFTNLTALPENGAKLIFQRRTQNIQIK